MTALARAGCVWAAAVSAVRAGSPAERAGLCAGDALVAVNGHRVRDIIDYRYLCCDARVTLRVRARGGEERLVRVAKAIDEDIGLAFSSPVFDGVRRCCNRCLFCFCDQLPPGLRPALYVKDDDYRLSFIDGNYISLTNLLPDDWRRIGRLRLGPLYVSVHATSGGLRARLMGSRGASRIMPQLWRLKRLGIAVHAQVVLCPGLNDGPHLDETLSDLAALGEALLSAAVVPVGLAAHRAGLHQLQPFDASRAAAVLERVSAWQRRFLRRRGRRTVFAADELYLRAGAAVPPAGDYEGFAQLEDGVGLVADLWHDWRSERRRLPAALPRPRRVGVITGELGAQILAPLVRDAGRVAGLHCFVVPVQNRTFGPGVTVAGLLAGRDIAGAAKAAGAASVASAAGAAGADVFLLPDVALRAEDRAAAVAASGARPRLAASSAPLLDGMTVGELDRCLGGRLAVVPRTAAGFCGGVLGEAAG